MMLTEKYRPKKLAEIIGNEEAKKKAMNWLTNFLEGKEEKPLFIYGPVGIGKTSLAIALANEFALEPLIFTSSEKREGNIIKNMEIAKGSSIFGKKRLIVFDDLDGITSEDKGLVNAIISLVKETKNPVILIANDFWDQKLKALRNICIAVEMKKPPNSEIEKLIKSIAEKEQIKDVDIKEIVKSANGDVRAALNNLAAYSIGYRDKRTSAYDVTLSILKGKNLEWPRKTIMQSDDDLELIKAWLDENIDAEYKDPLEIASAYDYLSKADLYNGRIIKRQYYGFLRYVSFFIACIALAKKHETSTFLFYKFPSYIKELSATMEKRAIKKSISKKIAKVLHTSQKTILQEFPFYSSLILRDIEKAKNIFKLDEKEIKFLEGENG